MTETLSIAIQRPESKEELEVLLDGDVVETTEGIMRIHGSLESDSLSCRPTLFYGRNIGLSINLILINYFKIDVRNGKLIFKRPYDKKDISPNMVGIYNLFDNKLKEIGR